MANLDEVVCRGHYARKQLLCKDRLISWSHRRRFEAGLRLARPFAGRRVLDYGCGDGTFLALLMSGPHAPAAAVGAERDGAVANDCRERLGSRPGLSFVRIDELDGAAHRGAYDAVICMEVLEHVVELEPVLERFARFLSPSGKLLISVPVETGLPLLVKQAVRRLAGWRGIGDYPGTGAYSFGEYWSGVFAGVGQHLERPLHRGSDGCLSHDHKGFNWRSLRELLKRQFRLEKTLGSPVAWLPPSLGSQVWFVMNKPS